MTTPTATARVTPSDPGPQASSPPGRSEIRVDRSAKRVRAILAGQLVADTIEARVGYATGRHPGYLVPTTDVTWANLVGEELESGSDLFGPYRCVRSSADDQAVGRHYTDGPAVGLVSFDFDKMDAWFEEDEQIWYHPRDPFRRVDVTESSRHIEITVNGTVVVSSDRPRLVTETGLPERWYVPRIDVDWSLLAPSPTSSGCQYKGLANWWHVSTDGTEQLADVVWGYERPIPEAAKLAGLVAFYAEHASVETYLDGILQPKPEMDIAALNPSLGLESLAAHASA